VISGATEWFHFDVGIKLAGRRHDPEDLMLQGAQKRLSGRTFQPILADMLRLPFGDHAFGKSVSITAIEFIDNAQGPCGILSSSIRWTQIYAWVDRPFRKIRGLLPQVSER